MRFLVSPRRNHGWELEDRSRRRGGGVHLSEGDGEVVEPPLPVVPVVVDLGGEGVGPPEGDRGTVKGPGREGVGGDGENGGGDDGGGKRRRGAGRGGSKAERRNGGKERGGAAMAWLERLGEEKSSEGEGGGKGGEEGREGGEAGAEGGTDGGVGGGALGEGDAVVTLATTTAFALSAVVLGRSLTALDEAAWAGDGRAGSWRMVALVPPHSDGASLSEEGEVAPPPGARGMASTPRAMAGSRPASLRAG